MGLPNYGSLGATCHVEVELDGSPNEAGRETFQQGVRGVFAACAQQWGRSEAALEIRSLIKTKQPQIKVHRYPARTERHFRRLFALLGAYLDAIHAGRFVCRPGQSCSFCEYRETYCAAWEG
jgi:hypothetical protein